MLAPSDFNQGRDACLLDRPQLFRICLFSFSWGLLGQLAISGGSLWCLKSYVGTWSHALNKINMSRPMVSQCVRMPRVCRSVGVWSGKGWYLGRADCLKGWAFGREFEISASIFIHSPLANQGNNSPSVLSIFIHVFTEFTVCFFACSPHSLNSQLKTCSTLAMRNDGTWSKEVKSKGKTVFVPCYSESLVPVFFDACLWHFEAWVNAGQDSLHVSSGSALHLTVFCRL